MFMPPSGETISTGPSARAIDDDAQVQLAGDVAACFDQHLADRLAFGAGLNRDQRLAEQRFGDLGGLVGALHQLHAALRRVFFDRSLAATAGVDLRLHHGDRAAELREGRGRFLRRAGDDAVAARRRPRWRKISFP